MTTGVLVHMIGPLRELCTNMSVFMTTPTLMSVYILMAVLGSRYNLCVYDDVYMNSLYDGWISLLY